MFSQIAHNLCHHMIEVWHFNLALGPGASLDDTHSNHSIQSWLRFWRDIYELGLDTTCNEFATLESRLS